MKYSLQKRRGLEWGVDCVGFDEKESVVVLEPGARLAQLDVHERAKTTKTAGIFQM